MDSDIHIVGLFIAPRHSYRGQPRHAPLPVAMATPERVECVAGQGLRGDRFFGYREDYRGQVTFFSAEVLEAVCAEVGVPGVAPWATRRNVLTRGIDLNALIGHGFELGGVGFEGTGECAPCHWMDQAIGPGARRFLAGRGGLRARITRSGWLSLGQACLRVPGAQA